MYVPHEESPLDSEGGAAGIEATLGEGEATDPRGVVVGDVFEVAVTERTKGCTAGCTGDCTAKPKPLMGGT